MRAMILAAGRGERMRPLTDYTPKPLLQAGGKSLIVHQIERLREAGIEQLVINVAWHGEMIERALGDGAAMGVEIRYSREPEGALETAGGIRHALGLIGDDPFVVVNSDVHCDFPIARLARFEPAGDGHLVLVGMPRFTYSGIGLFRPEMFALLTPGFRPLRSVLEPAIAAGRVTGEHYQGTWLDIGTPERLDRLDRDLGR